MKLSKREMMVLGVIGGNKETPMSALVDRFARSIRPPKKWTYHVSVPKKSRSRWMASLVARNSVRRLVREGLVTRRDGSMYQITAKGEKVLA